MKELKKNIIQLEHDRQKTLQILRGLDKSSGRDDHLNRIETVFRLEGIEAELADKKLTMSTAQLLPSQHSRLQVAIGSIVDLIDNSGRLFRFKIVDSVEANPSDGRISTLSPLGQTLIGKTIRDIVEWRNGLSVNKLQLIRII
jgi:transcription elongation GreA/GreB family factor